LLVFRRYRQDVERFKAFVAQAAGHVAAADPAFAALTPHALGAKLFGRWASGAPLVRSPDADNPALGGDDCASDNFAYAAAERYSGLWTPPPWQRDLENGTSDTPLPKVTLWTAWNEPNNPIWLTPQYKRVGGKWIIASAQSYAKICNAVYDGVHSPDLGPLPGEQVACGVTGPRGNAVEVDVAIRAHAFEQIRLAVVVPRLVELLWRAAYIAEMHEENFLLLTELADHLRQIVGHQI